MPKEKKALIRCNLCGVPRLVYPSVARNSKRCLKCYRNSPERAAYVSSMFNKKGHRGVYGMASKGMID